MTTNGGNKFTIKQFGELNIAANLSPTKISRKVQIKSVTSSEKSGTFSLNMYHFDENFKLKGTLVWKGTNLGSKPFGTNVHNFAGNSNFEIELMEKDKFFVEMFTTEQKQAPIEIEIYFL